MVNTELHKFMRDLRNLVSDAYRNGCPPYALSMGLALVSLEIDPIVRGVIENEATQSDAVPVGEPEIKIGEE